MTFLVFLHSAFKLYFVIYKCSDFAISDVRGFLVRKKWGPVLEERIKRIVSTHKSADSAKQALEVRN